MSESAKQAFSVPTVAGPLHFTVEIPGSKSITNRALLIAALSQGPVRLHNVLFSDDSKYFVDCLINLGFQVAIGEAEKIIAVQGQGGEIPKQQASIYVGSAGTAARFITAMLALSTGEYLVEASAQMMARPMKPLLDALVEQGASFEYLKNPYFLPFKLRSAGLKGGRVEMSAGQSSQFLSALLLAGCYSRDDLEIVLDGPPVAKPYVDMTLKMMKDFGVTALNDSYQRFTVPHGQIYHGHEYRIEPDVSNAGYFLAMAVLTGGEALVKDVKLSSLQGDIQFVKVLQQLGSTVEEREEGLYIKGPKDGKFPGIDVDMSLIPDQTMTLAAMAPFAASPVNIRNVSFIKFHESNRIQAIINELARVGIGCRETETGLIIYPGMPRAAEIETYDDHRMAMAFSLIGLKTPGVRIKNPGCTGKTFAGYFDCFTKAVHGPGH